MFNNFVKLQHLSFNQTNYQHHIKEDQLPNKLQHQRYHLSLQIKTTTKSHLQPRKTVAKIRMTKINSINNITYATLDNNSHACIRTDHVTRKMAARRPFGGNLCCHVNDFPGFSVFRCCDFFLGK